MSPIRSLAELRGVLSRWDKSARSQRQQILKEFIQNAKNMTGPELEKEFGNGASLFLTRICAYLRTVNMSGGAVGLSLQAISVFVGAASGHRFLVEFIEGGGLPVVAEILRKDQGTEGDRIKALQLLSNIASAGHTYKQMIGELDGIKAVCDFVRVAKTDPAHELARGLLVSLGRNSKRSEMLHSYLVELLMEGEPQVQRTAAQVLRQLLVPSVVEGVAAAAPDPGLVEAVCRMLSTTQAHVRYEAKELGLFALAHKLTQRDMVQSAVAMLLPEPYTYNTRPVHTPSDADLFGYAPSSANAYFDEQPVPDALLRQSACARLIGSFVSDRPAGNEDVAEVIEMMLEEGVVSSLLVCAANRDYDESSKAGVIALSALVAKSHAADERLHAVTGPTFHQAWHADSASCARTLDMDALNQLFADTGNVDLQYFNRAEDEQGHYHAGEGLEEGEEGEEGEEEEFDLTKSPAGEREGGSEIEAFPQPNPGEGQEVGGAREGGDEEDEEDEEEGVRGGEEEGGGVDGIEVEEK